MIYRFCLFQTLSSKLSSWPQEFGHLGTSPVIPYLTATIASMQVLYLSSSKSWTARRRSHVHAMQFGQCFGCIACNCQKLWSAWLPVCCPNEIKDRSFCRGVQLLPWQASTGFGGADPSDPSDCSIPARKPGSRGYLRCIVAFRNQGPL